MRNRLIIVWVFIITITSPALAREVMRFDFEDASTDSLWHFLHPGTNNWMIGNDMLDRNRQYTRALYISNDGTYFDYTTSVSQVAWAWTDIQLPADSLYTFSVDYNCYGEHSLDYFLLLLVADSLGLPTTPNSAYYDGLGKNVSLDNCLAGLPAGATLLTDFMPTGSNDWRTHTAYLWLPAGRYHLVAFWTNDSDYGVFPAALDNILLQPYSPTPDPTDPTSLSNPNPSSSSRATKIFRDGHLLLLLGSLTYSSTGQLLR